MIFFIVCCAYEEFGYVKRNSYMILSALIVSTCFLASIVYKYFSGSIEDVNMISYIVTFGIIVLSVLFSNKKLILSLLLFCEIIGSCAYDFKFSNSDKLIESSSIYNDIKIKTNDRSSIDTRAISNEEVFNNLNGISLFSSSINKEQANMWYKLGLRGGGNYMTAFGHSPVVDILMNLRYTYNKEGKEYLDYVETSNSEDGYSAYKNKYNTSYAYVLPKEVLNWDYSGGNPFDNINSFVGYYFGEHSSNTYVYDLVSPDNIMVSSNCETERNDEKNFGVTFNNTTDEKSYVSFSCEAIKDNMSVNIKYGKINTCNIYVNDTLVYSDFRTSGDIVNVPYVESGDIVTVKIEAKKDISEGTMYVNFATFNEENFEKFAEDITSNGMDVTIKDNKVTGKVKYKEDSILFISLPYAEGWNLSVNGEDKEIISDLCMMTFNIEEDGTFTYTYKTPYVNIGFVVSLVSWILFVIYCTYQKRKSRLSVQRTTSTYVNPSSSVGGDSLL
jgi:uncharacterized membrane protein YfhO